MKKISLLILLLLGIAALAAEDGLRFYPTQGVFNLNQGAVEVTVTPAQDVKDIRNGWFFAFLVPGKDNNNATRTILGIYTPSGNPESEYGIRGMGRGSDKQVWYVSDQNCAVKAGQTVNMAITWGPQGFIFYIDGKLIGKQNFKGKLLEMAPMFRVCDEFPFYTSKIKVSAKQLNEKELQFDAAKPFVADSECTFLGNDLDQVQYFMAPALKDTVSLLPYDRLANRIVYDDQSVNLQLIGNNFTDRAVKMPVKMVITTLGNKAQTAIEKSVEIDPKSLQKIYTLDLGKMPGGLYKIEITAGSQVMRFVKVSVLPRIDNAPEGKLSQYLGLANNREPEVFKKINVKWVRLWSGELNWFYVEPADGKFDFRTSDKVINGYLANDVQVLGVLGYPAMWAATPPPTEGDRAKFRYRRGEPGRWQPKNVEIWNRYVEAVAKQYKNKVQHFEIYNEVDFHPPGLAETFSGTTEDYFALLKGASESLKKVDPKNQVLVSGFSTTPTVCDTEMPQELVKLGAGKYVDIWNMHAYRARVGAVEMKKLAQTAKAGMPIWQTEQMWHVINDPDRLLYLTAAINLWFLDMGYEKFFGFGWGRDTLSDEHTASPEGPLHIFAVNQQFLAKCDRLLGVQKSLPAGEFDINHLFQRTDGSYLLALGSSAGNYKVAFQNKDLRCFDMFGKEIKLSGNTLETNGLAYYLITKDAPLITSVKLESSGQLLPNPNFEDLVGDTLVGIDQCKFAGWLLRDKSYDPQGKVAVTDKNANGKYTAELTTSGKGRVYVFSYLKLSAPGTYRISANFRNVSGSAKPYISTFDTTPKSKHLTRKDFATPPADRFVKYEVLVKIDKVPDDNLAVIFGIDGGAGTVLLDDVEMMRVEVPAVSDKDAVKVQLQAVDFNTELKSAKGVISLANLLILGQGQKFYASYPFLLNGKGLVAADSSWQNADGKISQKVEPGLYPTLLMLGCAMYVSNQTGVKLADLVLTYQDGSSAAIALRNNIELRDWYLNGKPQGGAPIAPAVTFDTADLQNYGLFAAPLANPEPGKTLTQVDLVSASPGVVAIAGLTLCKVDLTAANTQ